MLGSVADAEDIVQEAYLRLHTADPKPDSADAFLYRVVSNLSIDRLRRLKTEREAYVGPWLPEPLIEDDTLGAEQAEELGIGLMLLLEALTPAERIVYVLSEGFDFSFAQIATLLEISPASARQRGHRARKKVAAQGPRAKPIPAEQRALLEALTATVASKDVNGLLALLAEDAVAYTDGGGVVSAAIAPVVGRDRIAQITMHLVDKAQSEGPLAFRFVANNGGISLVMEQAGAVHSCLTLDIAGGVAQRLYVIRNPHKLSGLTS